MAKRRIFLVIATLTLIAIVPLAARSSASSASVQQDPCEGLEQVKESKTTLCTHGGDPRVEEGLGAMRPRSPAAATGAPCPDGGVSGKRVEVIYAVPQDQTNNYASSLASVHTAVDDADAFLDQSTPSIGGQHYRWLCENGTDVTVRNVTLIPVGADNQFTYGDMVFSLQNQVAQGLGTTDFLSSDRIYLVFVDQISAFYAFGGQGDIRNDDTPSPTTNLNQTGPHYSLINGFSGFIAEHEMGHNIGAVQLSAPHTSGAWHCFEENDVMCYSDGGPYFTGGGGLVFNCPTLPGTQFDCGQDDYYNGQAAAGTYLGTHWDTSDSAFLTPFEATAKLDHFKCYRAKESGTKFEPREVTLTDQFGTERVKVIRPVAFCTPVDKDGSGINDQTDHLTCYRVRTVEGATVRRQVEATDQFGTHTLQLRRTRTLCLPSTKSVL
jgi:hypothetical protein